MTMRCMFINFFILLILIGTLTSCNSTPGNKGSVADKVSSTPPTTAVNSGDSSGSQTVKNTLPESLMNKLSGKWLRSDGGYTIEVFSVRSDGSMDAGYFNPNPIHVEKSEWKVADNKLYMRVILKDVNYPGSTYTLMYNPEKDQLTGNYFQAVEGTNYDVAFQRLTEKK
jgi:hypothetical protein